jgi:pimeloyl-ACP methyl ester carboxylesterase
MAMELDIVSKRSIDLVSARAAYVDEGSGPPLVLLHGCPFSSHIWRKVIAELRTHFRCIAPDLLGLGDTETKPDADWALPAQAAIVMELLDRLGLRRVHVVGHDHGGAVAQLLAAERPQVIDRLVLVNVEAFDNWPSHDERPFIVATQLPIIGVSSSGCGHSLRWRGLRSSPEPLFTTSALSARHSSGASSAPT